MVESSAKRDGGRTKIEADLPGESGVRFATFKHYVAGVGTAQLPTHLVHAEDEGERSFASIGGASAMLVRT